MLRERGAEKTGYRGCLVGATLGGVVGAVFGVVLSRQYGAPAGMAAFGGLMRLMWGFIGFLAGSVAGVGLSFFVDLFTRRRESEEDAF